MSVVEEREERRESTVPSEVLEQWRRVVGKMLGLPVSDAAKPVYREALRHAEEAIAALSKPDYYSYLSHAFSAVTHLAYAAQLTEAEVKEYSWLYEELPRSPIEVVIPPTLPSNILPGIARAATQWLALMVDEIVRRLKQEYGVYTKYFVDSTPLKTLAMYTRRKQEIEQAVDEMTQIIDALRAHGATVDWSVYLDYHSGGVPEGLRGRGYEEVRVVCGTHRGIDPRIFRKIMEDRGFTIREKSLGDRHLMVAVKHFGDVELSFSCDAEGRGVILVTFYDVPPTIPAEIERPTFVEGILLQPSRVFEKATTRVGEDTVVEIRKVQSIGGKLALYLTTPLKMIGVTDSDHVEVIVDRKQKTITIRPLRTEKPSTL